MTCSPSKPLAPGRKQGIVALWARSSDSTGSRLQTLNRTGAPKTGLPDRAFVTGEWP